MEIGYIYKYSEEEGKGILVYGNYDYPRWKKPILFSKNNCKSEVKSGQLVFFNLISESEVDQIERASLLNFNRELIDDLSSCYVHYAYKDYDKWHKLTHIFFEDISKLQVRTEKIVSSSDEDYSALIDEMDLDTYVDYLYWDDDLQDIAVKDEIVVNVYVPISLPNDIESLYTIFGTDFHEKTDVNKESIAIDLLDIKYWTDNKMVNNPIFYCDSIEKVLELFELFEIRRKKAYSKDIYTIENKEISKAWRYVLSRFNDNDLKDLLKQQPLFQPALPRKFCDKYLDALSINEAFSTIPICEAYCRYRVNKAQTTTDYVFLKEKLEEAINAKGREKSNDGVHLFNIKKKTLIELKNTLDYRYSTVIFESIKKRIAEISNDNIVIKYKRFRSLTSAKKNYIQKLGFFIDKYDSILHDIEELTLSHHFSKKLVSSYDQLSDNDKKDLRPCMERIAVDILVLTAKSNSDIKALDFSESKDYLGVFIDEHVYSDIIKKVNSEFLELNDLDDLKTAFSSGLITENQYLEQYKRLTQDFHPQRLAEEILYDYSKYLPKSIQEYLIRRIIQLCDFEDLSQRRTYYKFGFDEIHNLNELLEWFNGEKGRHLDSAVLDTVLDEMSSSFSEEERWNLFVKGLIPSPYIETIRKKIDEAYERGKISDNWFSRDCFQSVLVEDILKEDSDFVKMRMILEHLNYHSKEIVREKGNDYCRFLIWVSKPDDVFLPEDLSFDDLLSGKKINFVTKTSINWDQISSYYYLLTPEEQIQILKYIFYLRAVGKEFFSERELYLRLTNDEQFQIYKPICVLLFLLEKKALDLSLSISSDEMKTFCGVDNILNEPMDTSDWDWLNLWTPAERLRSRVSNLILHDFFFECRGHFLFSWRNTASLEHLSSIPFYYIGTIEKNQKENKTYYVISFFDRAKDEYGHNIEYFDDCETIDEAKSTLENNIPYELIDSEYWIFGNEIELREFIIEYPIYDRCGLFNDRYYGQYPLHTNCIYIYSENEYKFCKCVKKCRKEDPKTKIPFYWCDKQPCTRRAKYLVPVEEWRSYRFVDLLYILYNRNIEFLDRVWDADAEISMFLNSFTSNPESFDDSKSVSPENEIGEWNDAMSIVSDVNDNFDEYFYGDDDEDGSEEDDW